MEGLTLQIYNWLKELEENNAAEFLSDCYISNFYIDTAYAMDSDRETQIYEFTINVPLKVHKKISQYSKEIAAIESAIHEYAESDGIYIRNIDWRPYLKNSQDSKNKEKGEQISKILTQEYVDMQIKLMNNSIDKNPHLALGISKELIETCCKYILSEKGIIFEKDWDILKLVKETNRYIELIPFEVENITVAKSSVAKILSGFSIIVHGVAELRNSYGTGHGHTPDFKMLDSIYVKLAVTSSSELALFYLTLQKLNNGK